MVAGTQTQPDAVSERESDEAPEIVTCESSPGKTVFLESENTDGWISTDVTVDVTR